MSNVFVWTFWTLNAIAALRLALSDPHPVFRGVGWALCAFLVGIAYVLWRKP